jgi:predicted SAM-dependent methyltransferase
MSLLERVRASRPRVLNWGCGDHLVGGWINSDVKDEPGIDLVADIRRGLPLEADSVDAVVSVHALPELSYADQVPALRELRRVLRPGGVLRLALPDFDRAIAAYQGGEEGYFQVPPEEIASHGGRFLAHSLWFGYTRTLFTADFVAELLEKAAFERVRVCAYRRTASPFGSVVRLDNRPRESMYLEARKPAGIAARFLPYNPRVPADDLEIVDLTSDPGDRVRGNLTARRLEDRRLEIGGWVVGSEMPVVEVEVTVGDAVAATTSVELDRADVADRFPGLAGAGTSGFRLELQAQGEGVSQLEVHAVLEDESREPLGRILVETDAGGGAAAA